MDKIIAFVIQLAFIALLVILGIVFFAIDYNRVQKKKSLFFVFEIQQE